MSIEGLYCGIRSYILLIASLNRSGNSLKISHGFLTKYGSLTKSHNMLLGKFYRTYKLGAYPPRVSDFEVVYLFIDTDSDQKAVSSPHCICSILKTR